MPSVFISYSWEKNNKEWVAELATQLEQDGITVVLDQWSIVSGDLLTSFMEKSISENDFVLIICTPSYKEKSNKPAGGVKYEGDIIKGEKLVYGNERKFIPILKEGPWEQAAPSIFLGKYYIDLSNSDNFMSNYRKLKSDILNPNQSHFNIPHTDFSKTAKKNFTSTPSLDLENLVKAAETFINESEYEKAKEKYDRIANEYPSDFRGWWGLVVCMTRNFTLFTINNLSDFRKYFERGYKYADMETRKELESTYDSWLESFYDYKSFSLGSFDSILYGADHGIPPTIPFVNQGFYNASRTKNISFYALKDQLGFNTIDGHYFHFLNGYIALVGISNTNEKTKRFQAVTLTKQIKNNLDDILLKIDNHEENDFNKAVKAIKRFFK